VDKEHNAMRGKLSSDGTSAVYDNLGAVSLALKRLFWCLRCPFLPILVTVVTRLMISAEVLATFSMQSFWGTNETGTIAGSLVAGRGFTSPYDASQPTAWLAPAYPFLVSLVFRIFGVHSNTATWVLIAFNTLCSALTCAVIYLVGHMYFGEFPGILAAWVWALCLQDAVMPLTMWDTSLSSLLFGLAFLAIPVLEESDQTQVWLGAGLFAGFTTLVNPALLGPAPFIAGYLAFFRRRQGKKTLVLLAPATLMFVLVLLPWTIRNYQRFGKIFFVRSNLAAEVYYGNLGYESHPRGPSREYQQLGESEYIRQKRHLALNFLRQHPEDFFKRSVQRWAWFWVMPKFSIYWPLMSLLCWIGLAFAVKNLQARSLPFVFALLVFPIVYSVTLVFPKYRHPVVPVMFLLVGYVVGRAHEQSNRTTTTLGRVADLQKADPPGAVIHELR
jgi:Dolichyl-phosphate-mannose-protein mannosyltransferase